MDSLHLGLHVFERRGPEDGAQDIHAAGGGFGVSGRVIHLLTETDSFSDVHGAALQRWVANVLRFEENQSVVACARADGSWGLSRVDALRLPGLWAYSKLRGRYHLPWNLR